MRQRHGVLLLSGLLALSLSGCGSTSVGTESGTITAPAGAPTTSTPTAPSKAAPTSTSVAGSDDSAISSASVGGTLSVTVGASQTINVVFTSSDGKPMSGFAVSGSLSTLPAGWRGPGNFTCAAVGPGSGCVLTLTYAPTAIASGTLMLTCVFIDNANTPRTPGPCLTLNFAATAANNVAATPSQAGEMDAVAGAGAQSLNVNFTTDDGTPATALQLTTDLHSLPAGWSSTAASFNCPLVRVGNGCQLPLSFAPAGAARGTLTLNYSYLDNSGASRSGSLNVPYAGVAVGTVVATTSPSGQINAVESTGSTTMAVTFNTTDGKGATSLGLMTDLSTLPAGWSSASSSFGCAAVSTGNGCQLHLKYSPAALTSGTITLRYVYLDSSGAANTGVVNVGYAATTDDNVIETPSTVGELTVMTTSSQSVAVTFTTDDGRVATGLQITSGLTAMPAGWSSGSGGAFGCVALASGTGCQLNLAYAPTAGDSGTLALGFSYLNNAGETKTGTVSIPYRATVDDNLIATVNPLSVAATVGVGYPVTVTFTTQDGNVGTGLTADLTSLPAEWAATPSPFSCSSVSVGGTCVLNLTYTPMAAVSSSTLSFGASFTNNAGLPKSVTVSIPYSATP